MPLYQYKCNPCDLLIEINKPYSQSESIQNCEECGNPMVKKFGRVGVQFRGSGFYSTDKR